MLQKRVHIQLSDYQNHKKHFIPPPVLIRLSEDDRAPQTIQLFRCGNFTHAEFGELPITPQFLSDLESNYRKNVRGIDLAVDYSHESGREAAAWIKDIYLDSDGTELWARVAWTPSGEESVTHKEFRYISPDFSFDSEDAETGSHSGPILNGCALTNRPFLKRMAPIINLHETKTMEEDMADITLADAKKQIKELEAKTAKLSDLTEKLTAFEKALNGETPEDLVAKVTTLQGEAEAAKVQLSDFKKKAGEATIQAAEAKKSAEFTVLLTEGKVCEAQRKAFLSGDTVEFAKLSEPVKLKTVGTGEPPPLEASNSEEAQKEIVKLATVKLSEKKCADIGEAIRQVLTEKKDLADKYSPQRVVHA